MSKLVVSTAKGNRGFLFPPFDVFTRTLWTIQDTLETSAGASTGVYWSIHDYIWGAKRGNGFIFSSWNLHHGWYTLSYITALPLITFKKLTGGWATAFLIRNEYHTDICLATLKQKLMMKKIIDLGKGTGGYISKLCICMKRQWGNTLRAWGAKSICIFQSSFKPRPA